MTRLGHPVLTAAASAMDIEQHRKLAEQCIAVLSKRGGDQAKGAGKHTRLTDSLHDRATKILEAWQKLTREAREEGASKRSYSRFDRDKTAGRPLLFTIVDDDVPPVHSAEARFAAPTSMRDVEPSVHLWLDVRR